MRRIVVGNLYQSSEPPPEALVDACQAFYESHASEASIVSPEHVDDAWGIAVWPSRPYLSFPREYRGWPVYVMRRPPE